MLINTVKNTIKEYNMINKGDKIFVALSGGADSVCLLCALNSLKEELGITLEAIHINHCIRGTESDSDEDFCLSLCQSISVRIHTYRIDIPKLSQVSGKSLEETARDARYEKFSETAGKTGKIATAHTLSDNAETVIFNMVRGSGLKGLCGIPAVRDNIIRPLSAVTRKQIEEYLKEINQSFKTDSTNLSDDYTRNKIRHKIIPVIQEINEGFFKSFANSQTALKEENAFIEEITANACTSHCKDNRLINMNSLNPVICKRVISRFLSSNNLPVSFDKINDVYRLTQKNGRLNISKNTFIVGENGCISIETKSENTDKNVEIPLKTGKNTIFENKYLTASNDKNGRYLIDMDKVSGKIILRNRRFGDKIRLSGRGFTSSVKKLLNEKVSCEQRPFIHFLADDLGLIFMEDFGVADRVKTDENSENILSVNIEKQKGI